MDLAIKVCSSDDAVDAMHASVFSKVAKEVVKQPEHVDQLLTYLSVSRYLERIADHTTNISELAIETGCK